MEGYKQKEYGVPGSTSDQKWQMMERMFYLYDE